MARAHAGQLALLPTTTMAQQLGSTAKSALDILRIAEIKQVLAGANA